MGTIAVIAFTERGCRLAQDIARELVRQHVFACLETSVSGPERFAADLGIQPYESLASWTAAHFGEDDALVFVGASGIAVRAIAPHVRDKFTDPAVVSVDEAGRFVVPLLSGHVGGANDLARAVARVTGGQAAVSTATDVNGLFAVDEWAARHGMHIAERVVAKEISAALLAGTPVGVRSDFPLDWEGALPEGLTEGPADIGFYVTFDTAAQPFARTLHLIPRNVTVGAGCRRDTQPAVLKQAVDEALARANVPVQAVRRLASIDVKKDEPAIRQLAAERGWELKFYTADELAAVSGDFTASEFVRKTVGVDNVCERSALAEGGTLLLGKQAGNGVTVALARTAL